MHGAAQSGPQTALPLFLVSWLTVTARSFPLSRRFVCGASSSSWCCIRSARTSPILKYHFPRGYTCIGARRVGSARRCAITTIGIAHFAYGLLFTYPLHEVAVRMVGARGFWRSAGTGLPGGDDIGAVRIHRVVLRRGPSEAQPGLWCSARRAACGIRTGTSCSRASGSLTAAIVIASRERLRTAQQGLLANAESVPAQQARALPACADTTLVRRDEDMRCGSGCHRECGLAAPPRRIAVAPAILRSMTRSVAIVGAGPGGLAAAMLMAQRGRR